MVDLDFVELKADIIALRALCIGMFVALDHSYPGGEMRAGILQQLAAVRDRAIAGGENVVPLRGDPGEFEAWATALHVAFDDLDEQLGETRRENR